MIYLITILIATLSSSSSFSQTNCQEARQKYWILYPDVANAKFDPYQHYQIHGKNEGRIWPACRGEEQDCEKAKSQYYKLYPDVYNAGANAWTHYQTYGFKEGRVWPFSKCEPSLEAVSIATLKKWKSNPIEDDNRKGENTFTFSPDNVNSAQENASTSNIITNEIKQKDKYYSVSHNSWGEFMNKYAVWVDNKVKANEGKNTALEFSFSLLESKIYDIEVAGDDKASIIIDGEKLSIISNFNDREKINIFLKKGKHICSVQLLNISSSSSRWQDNPVGFGMVISDNGKTIITTRDQEYVVKETPKYYPVSHPVWNDLLKNHAVWINNKENNHEGEWKELSFQTTMLQSGFYNFEISADDTSEFILDGKKIMDISYQKGIHNFKIKLEEGVHQLQMKVMNFTLYKSKWEDNAVGAAILIKDNSGNIVFSTRDGKHCYEEMIAVQRSSENNKQNIPDIHSNSLEDNILFSANPLSPQLSNFITLPKIKNFVFSQVSSKVIPGTTQETSLINGINPVDMIGNLGIVSMFYHNGCYTDGTYNHKDYLVEKGVVKDVNGSENYEAYTIHGPNHKAVKFLASHHNAYYKFPTIEDYSIFILESNDFRKIGEINASVISTTGYTHIPFIDISSITGATTYVFIPKIVRLSALHIVNKETEGAEINRSSLGKTYKIKYKVSGSPIDNIHNNSSKNKSLFSFISNDNTLGLIWQDIESNSIHLTEIDNNLLSTKTIEMPNPNGGFLAAATGNKKGEVFYVTIQDRQSNSSDLILSKYNTNNRTHSKNQLNTAQNLIDVNWFAKDVASLCYDKDTLLFAFSRTHHKSNDGLHHQSGTVIIFESKSLNLLKSYGITTSHSFDNIATTDINGDFITVEMGDAYPRGLNFRKFQRNGLSEQAKSLYTYKTVHSNSPNNNGKMFPAYNEISNSSMKYYKWSNDNNTYTEIGNVIDTRDGYLLSFLGEPDPSGYSLNNKWMGGSYPRNVGFVKVSRDFTQPGSGSYLSKGINETGGFFDYWGNWNVQNNYGVVWLTKYNEQTLESAKFLKNIKLNDNTLLFMWEKWHNGSYFTTIAQKTDYHGNAKGGLIDLGKSIRLDRKNDLLVNDNTLFIFSSSNTEHKLGIICIKLE